jgi:DNA-binding NarL/FixJ family response regulator
MKPIQVLIADDHTLVRAGFRSLLQNITGVEVVAEAGDGHEALQKIKAHHPDIVLMDIAMPELNGLEVVARVSKEFPHVRVIILSMHANEEYVLQALRAGAAGYLLKNAAFIELEVAVTSVARGETYLTPAVSKHVIEEYLRRTGGVPNGEKVRPSPFKQLTPRQREVLQLIAEGHTTKEIAQKLNVSVKTVETHRNELMQRLDIHDVAGLVRYTIRIGLVSPEK